MDKDMIQTGAQSPAKPKSIRLRMLALVLGICLILSGCYEVRVQATISPVVEQVSAVPVEGGTLNLSIPNAPGPANPLTAQTQEMVSLLGMVYEGLIRYDENGGITPCLAESWAVSPGEEENGITLWTLNLRKNVVWHDGTPFTAQDVVDTVLLIRSEETLRYQEQIKYISTIEAVDEHTVRIGTVTPFYGLLDALTFPILQSGADLEGKPCGTGPFMVKSFSPSQGMELNANPNWWKRAAHISQIIAHPVPDEESALAAYAMEQVDAVATSLLSAAYYRGQENTAMLEYMTSEYLALIPNFKRPLLSDVRMRKAITQSLDKKGLLSSVFGVHAVPTDVPILPDTRFVDASVQGPEFSERAARDLLADMGYKPGVDGVVVDQYGQPMQPLILLVCESAAQGTRKELATLVGQALSKVGIPVTVQPMEYSRYIEAVYAGEFDLLMAAMSITRIPDYSFFFSSTNPDGQNVGSYNSTQMDALLGEVKMAESEAELKQAVLAVQRKIVEDLPHIPLCFRTNSLLYRDTSVSPGVLLPRAMDVYRGIEYWTMVEVVDQE